MRASAPGKLHVSGEYAVLDGATAVLVAVDRRARASLSGDVTQRTPLVDALVAEIVARYGMHSPQAERAHQVTVDSTELSNPIGTGGAKLGLGSSAATVVAAAALALASTDRALIQAVAAAAHATAQGARGAAGSGADIAAATWGGAIAFRRGAAPRALRWPPGVHLLPLWFGAPADTPTLVAHVMQVRATSPRTVGSAIQAIAEASDRLALACEQGDAAAVIAAISAGADAMTSLAEATGAPLVPAKLAAVTAIAKRFGGAAKTTGAGGGDVGVVVLPADAPVELALASLAEASVPPLALAISQLGVDFDAAAE